MSEKSEGLLNRPIKERLAVVGVTLEVLVGLGCTLLLFLKYYESAEGAAILTSVGVVLLLAGGVFGLHFFIKAKAPAFALIACIVWIGATAVECMLGGVVYMARSHGKDVASVRKQIAEKEFAMSEIPKDDKQARKLLTVDISELKGKLKKQDKPPFDKEVSPELFWLYDTGIHVLPFPCGAAAAILLIIFGVIVEAKQEEKLKKQQEVENQTARGGQYSTQPHDPPPARKAGFQPLPVYGKDKEADDPKERGH